MALWGLLAQGIQDTVGHITGAFTGTHPIHQAKHQMQTADRDISLQEDMFKYQMGVDQRNYEHSLEKWEYDKAIQQQMFAREDNAVQRRAADLKAAGINPLLAAGQAAGAGPHVAATAPMKEVTAKAVSMSPKLQALEMQNQINFQRKARSLQLSEMITRLELMMAEKRDKDASAREKDALTEEIKERTLGYSGQRGEVQARINHMVYQNREILSRIGVNNAQIDNIIADTIKTKTETEEALRNYNIAKAWGVRSDLKYSRYANDIMQLGSSVLKTYGFSNHMDAIKHMKDYIIKAAGEFARGNLKEAIPTAIKDFTIDFAEAIKKGISENELIQRILGFIGALENINLPPGGRSPNETLRNTREGPLFR